MDKRPAGKVLLVGWDAADWKMIHPLLDDGKMPALESLVDHGSIGNIATLDPPMSPMLWTSIATGMRADKHGILGFTEPASGLRGIRPVTVTSRKVKAVWNILNQNGFKSNIVGWWPSHPAEPLNGVMVSNFYHHIVNRLDEPWPIPKQSVHPPRLDTILKELRIHPEELTEAHLLPFVPQAYRIDQDKDRRLFTLAKIIAECATVHAAATWVMENEPWDFMAVYYDGIDHFSHAFMNYHPPKMVNISADDFEIYKDVVAGAYRFHDMMLDRLLTLAGPETTVVLVSDHGFHADHLRPKGIPDEPAGPAHQHRPYGIICLKGPCFRRDENIFGATLLDVAPTILTLFGLPIGRDMDGRPLIQAFQSEIRPEYIPSWERVDGDSGMHPPERREDPLANQEAMEQLIALGYIEPPDENLHRAIEKSANESKFYLARVYMNSRRHKNALPLLEWLHSHDSSQIRYGFYLAKCYYKLGRGADCRRVIDRIIKQHDSEFPQLDLLQGTLCLLERRYDRALEFLLKAEEADPRLPTLHNQIGRVYSEMRFWPGAERAFLKGLDIDPDSADAHNGLAFVHLRQERWKDAAEAALSAVGLHYHYPSAHYHLGLALEAMEEFERAAEAFEICLIMSPGNTDARDRLVRIYEKRLGKTEAAEDHRRRMVKPGARTAPVRRVRVKPEFWPPGRPDGLFQPPKGSITVVSGLPRSGTSMMMRMLDKGGMPLLTDSVRRPDEDNPRGYYECEKARGLLSDNTWLGEAENKAVKIIAPLLYRLPEERFYFIVFMERDLDEVLASQRIMRSRSGGPPGPADPDQLRKTYQRKIEEVKNWIFRRPDMKLFPLSYRSVIEDPQAAAEGVNAFLGGGLSVSAMVSAVEPGLYRQQAASLPIEPPLSRNRGESLTGFEGDGYEKIG